MRAIRKSTEPKSLAQHRSSPHADYDNYTDKDTLRQALVAEQRGLCCYCLSRIRPDRAAMKIEHWRSQSQHPDEQLNYRNLLAACPGVSAGQHHCDTAKADAPLSRNPAEPLHRVEHLIAYGRGDGKISSPDAAFNQELKTVLNLNADRLANRRKELLRAFVDGIERERATDRDLEKELAYYSGESHSGELEPYCMIIVWWIRKRLRIQPPSANP